MQFRVRDAPQQPGQSYSDSEDEEGGRGGGDGDDEDGIQRLLAASAGASGLATPGLALGRPLLELAPLMSGAPLPHPSFPHRVAPETSAFSAAEQGAHSAIHPLFDACAESPGRIEAPNRADSIDDVSFAARHVAARGPSSRAVDTRLREPDWK